MTTKQRNGKRAGDREAIETRRRKVWQLRLARMSEREIARRLAQEGISVSAVTVHNDIKHTLAELAKQRLDDAQAARDMEIASLDALTGPLWAKFQAGNAKDEFGRLDIRTANLSLKAADVLLKVSERRAKLLGLDAPQQLIVKVELAERLQQHGLTASEALEMFLNELDRAKADA